MRIRAALAISCTLVGACAPSWPGRATSVADPRLPAGAVRSIDVLPADLQLWTDDDAMVMPDDVERDAEATLVRATVATLAERQTATNVLDWDGNVEGVWDAQGPALAPDAVVATVDALSAYGSMAEHAKHGLPTPYLPARLGELTHADATLYVGGWSFVAKDGPSTGATVAKDIALGLAIVAVVGIVIAIAAASKGGHGSGGSGGGGGGGGGGHGIALAAGHVAGSAGRAALRAGNVGIEVAKVTAQIGDEVIEDAFGHAVESATARPDWSQAGPHGGDARLYLEMTLVDNHTGLALWHAHQTFPARANHPEEVVRAARVVLATMPR